MISKANKDNQDETVKQWDFNKEEIRFLTLIEDFKDYFFGMDEDSQENTTIKLAYYDLFFPSKGDGYTKLQEFLGFFVDKVTDDADNDYSKSLYMMKELIEEEILKNESKTS